MMLRIHIIAIAALAARPSAAAQCNTDGSEYSCAFSSCMHHRH